MVMDRLSSYLYCIHDRYYIYNKTRLMRNRISQRPYVHNGREAVLYERMVQGDCTFCPANHNENAHGSRSKWGRKVAMKQYYSTGRKRKEINWYDFGPWDLTDYHYMQEHYKNKWPR